MLQGTSSSVGKSILAAALCRLFYRAGYRTAPFKSQNMALNSGVARDGGEMGRAQVLQAYAAGVEPQVRMNPVLLKPTAPASSQVVLLGKPVGNFSAAAYHGNYNQSLLGTVEAAYAGLEQEFEVLVLEGAGSPVEINLKEHEIVNMRIAKMAGAPVLLVVDIDRGGSLAAVVGTLELLEPEERDLVAGVLINKFRGDLDLLRPALDFLENKTGKPVLGVIPYLTDLGLPEEDSVALERRKSHVSTGEEIDIAVVATPRIANFTDFDPLEKEPGVNLRYVWGDQPLGRPDLLILPGSKNTLGDRSYLEHYGKLEEIKKLAALGTPIIGICGGYQLLGREITDGQGLEGGDTRKVPGLGLLEVTTNFTPIKATHLVEAKIVGDGPLLGPCRGMTVRGYEIHMGESRPLRPGRAVAEISKQGRRQVLLQDGALSADGMIWGTYIHGVFDNDNLRGRILAYLRQVRGLAEPQEEYRFAADLDERLDRLARIVGKAIDLKKLSEIMGLPAPLEVRDFVSS